jgi:hypothetical protein
MPVERAMDGLAEWHYREGGVIQIVENRWTARPPRKSASSR